MTGRSSPTAEPAERVLVITRTLDAPRNRVFKAWTEPGQLARWWGPRGFTTPSCEMDVRPGGAYRTCIRSAEGKDHWMSGVYREVVEPESLVFTFAWDDGEGRPGHETLVTVTFAEDGGRTRLTFHQAAFEAVEDRDSHQGGWTECLERLEGYLASLGDA